MSSDRFTGLSVFGGIPVHTDPALEPGVIELRHPNGRVDRFDLDPERHLQARQAVVVMTATWGGLGWFSLDDVVFLFTPPPVFLWDFTVQAHEQYVPKTSLPILRTFNS